MLNSLRRDISLRGESLWTADIELQKSDCSRGRKGSGGFGSLGGSKLFKDVLDAMIPFRIPSNAVNILSNDCHFCQFLSWSPVFSSSRLDRLLRTSVNLRITSIEGLHSGNGTLSRPILGTTPSSSRLT